MSNRIEELKLIAQCIATDNREAFSKLVTLHSASLRRFVLNLTGGDYYLTDDIAQDTFLKAWMGIKSFRRISGFRTWLFRIAINEYVSYRRKSHDNVYIDSLTSVPPELAEHCPHSNTETEYDVKAAIGVLSDAERIVTLLFYLEDMPLKQICKITELPEGTVKSHLSRARKKMHKFLIR